MENTINFTKKKMENILNNIKYRENLDTLDDGICIVVSFILLTRSLIPNQSDNENNNNNIL